MSTRDALIIGGTVILIYASFVIALIVAGRRGDARALAGFIPDCEWIATHRSLAAYLAKMTG